MKTVAGLLLVCAALLCNAVTITYRDGRAMVCDILAKGDTNLIVRTVKGVQTNRWRELTTASFKAVHPELYQRLAQQALARKKQNEDEMQAKGMIMVGGKWVDQKAYEMAALTRVKLNVVTTESVGKYNEVERLQSGSKSTRPKSGVLKIKLDSLDKTRTYTLRAQYTMYTSDNAHKEVDKDKEQQETISNAYTHSMEIRTTPLEEYKYVYRYTRGTSADVHKIDITGWDVKVWLDQELIYEQTRGSSPVYHSVTKW